MFSSNSKAYPLGVLDALWFALAMLFRDASINILLASIVPSFSYLARAFLKRKWAAEVISRYSNASAVLFVSGTAILWQRILLYPSLDE
jgi:hypothetical protein